MQSGGAGAERGFSDLGLRAEEGIAQASEEKAKAAGVGDSANYGSVCMEEGDVAGGNAGPAGTINACLRLHGDMLRRSLRQYPEV